ARTTAPAEFPRSIAASAGVPAVTAAEHPTSADGPRSAPSAAPRADHRRVVDRRAAVHDDEEPRVRSLLGGLLVPDVQLHPDRLRPDLDRLLDVRHDEVRAAEQ